MIRGEEPALGTPEPPRYGSDAPWMGEVVIQAKHLLVWLTQLSQRYGTPIRRLDEIPDEELQLLAQRGVSALWPIGIWRRSAASRAMKVNAGDLDAEGSAYAVAEYVVDEGLGGDSALATLRTRAGAVGIRIVTDMVPNHVAIDGRWVKIRAIRKIVPQLITVWKRSAARLESPGSTECSTAAAVNTVLSAAISARSVPVPRSTGRRVLSRPAAAAAIATGAPTANVDKAARSCSLLTPEKKSGRLAVIHVTRARRIPALSRSEAMTTSSFMGDPVAVRGADLLIQGVCALSVACAAFALPSLYMLRGLVLVTYAALATAEFVRGVGLIASGALTYGLLGGALPAEGGYDRIVAYAAFATIALGALDLLLLGAIAMRAVGGGRTPRAQIFVSLGLSVLLILAGGALTPQVAMLVLATLLALAIRLEGATQAANG